jgi:hypothetical protein
MYFTSAQLSMAAYANLTVGMSLDQYKQELVRVGFTDDLAQEFVTQYSIAADTFSNAQGLAVNLFQKTGSTEKVLAIRGTEGINTLSDLVADGRIVIGEAADLNPQYAALKNYYQQLVASGVLGTMSVSP